MSRRPVVQALRPSTLGAALMLALGGCIPETVTPLSASDGGTPARDRALDVDESIRQVDAARDAEADAATGEGCSTDAGRADGSTSCADGGEPDVSGDRAAEPG